MKRAGILLACVLAGGAAGCSLVMTERPKPPPAPHPACTRSYGAVGLDILGALTWPLVLGAAYVVSKNDDNDGVEGGQGATTVLIMSGTFLGELVSAGVGISRVGDCRDAYRARERAAYPPPPPPPPP